MTDHTTNVTVTSTSNTSHSNGHGTHVAGHINANDDALLPPGWSPAAMASADGNAHGSSLAALLGLGHPPTPANTNTNNNGISNDGNGTNGTGAGITVQHVSSIAVPGVGHVPLPSQLATAAAALNMSVAHLQQLLLAGSVAMAQTHSLAQAQAQAQAHAQAHAPTHTLAHTVVHMAHAHAHNQPVGVVLPAVSITMQQPMASLAQQYGAVPALQPLNGILHTATNHTTGVPVMNHNTGNGATLSSLVGESNHVSSSSSLSSSGSGTGTGTASQSSLPMIKPLAPPASRKKRTSRDSTDSIKTSRGGRDDDDSESISSSVAIPSSSSSAADEPKRRRSNQNSKDSTSSHNGHGTTPSSPSARLAAAGAVAQARVAAAQSASKSSVPVLQSYPGSHLASSDTSSVGTVSSRRSSNSIYSHNNHHHTASSSYDNMTAVIPSSSSSSSSSSVSSSLLSPGSSVDNNTSGGMEPPILLRQLYDSASWTDVFARVSEILKRDRVRQKTAAEQVRLSSSTLSPMLKNKYKHTKEEHVIRLREWSWARDSTMWQNVQVQAARCNFDHVGLACAIGVSTDEVVQWMNGSTPLLQRYQLDTILSNWLKSQSAATPLTAMANMNIDDNAPSSPNSDNALPSPRSTASVTSASCPSPLPASATPATPATPATASVGAHATPTGTVASSRSNGAKTRSGSQRSSKNPSPVPSSGNGNGSGNGHVSPIPWTARTSSGNNGVPHLAATSPSPRASRSTSSSSSSASPGGNQSNPSSTSSSSSSWANATSPPIVRGVSPTMNGSGNGNGGNVRHKSGASNGMPSSARAFWAGPNAIYPTMLLTPSASSTLSASSATKLESPVPSSVSSASSSTASSVATSQATTSGIYRPTPMGRTHSANQPYNDGGSVGLSFSMSPARVISSSANHHHNHNHNNNNIASLVTPTIMNGSAITAAIVPSTSSSSATATSSTTLSSVSSSSATNTVQSIPSSSSSISSVPLSSSSSIASPMVKGETNDNAASAAFDLVSLAALATTDSNIPSSHTNGHTNVLSHPGKENAVPLSSTSTATTPSSPLPLFKKSGAVRRAPATVTSPSLASASNGKVRTAAANNPHIHRKSGAMTINPNGHHGHGHGHSNGMSGTSLTSQSPSSIVRNNNGVGNGNASPARTHSRGRSLAAHVAANMPVGVTKVSQPIAVGHSL